LGVLAAQNIATYVDWAFMPEWALKHMTGAASIGPALMVDAAVPGCAQSVCLFYHCGCVYFKKKYGANKRFSVTLNLRYMHGVLNVDKIKN
jgi:hypothetical protein